MNNKQFMEQLSKELRLGKEDTRLFSEEMARQMASTVVLGATFNVAGFGIFELKMKPTRKMYNPVTGKTTEIPERKSVGFRPSEQLKKKFNK